ncbi:MAG: preprotein translocase subunit YajC [Actinobacteria bacterium]|nr:preprotein translocase subunit YajC [Actinomycetota bacterium]
MLPVLLVLMYLLVIRPQQQRVRAHQSFLTTLAVGDDVISNSGIYGRVTALDEEVATIEVAPGVQVRVARVAIARRVPEASPADPADPADPTASVDGPRL